MNLPSLSSIGQNLRTQNNRMTADPIFLVQQKVRDYGLDTDYADSHEITWIDQDSEVDASERIRLEAEYDKTLDIPDGYHRTAFRDRWETVQPFFTEQGAKDYIAINGHNLREPRIYVDSAYRNAEWQAIRAFLMDLPEGGWKS